MSAGPSKPGIDHAELASLYALQALPEAERAVAEAHIAQCPECARELEALGPIIGSMAAWPTDVVRSPAPLWERLAQRIAPAPEPSAGAPVGPPWREPEWREVAPGISVKILATDHATSLVSMLVRLAPGIDYPPHSHGGVEELHLLDGELWINDRKLHPGDYNRAEPGTADKRVWSETGCTCVLITSHRDRLG